ncbi:MAG: hypothetical protein ACR5LA_07520 [Wolbachia sp.]
MTSLTLYHITEKGVIQVASFLSSQYWNLVSPYDGVIPVALSCHPSA